LNPAEQTLTFGVLLEHVRVKEEGLCMKLEQEAEAKLLEAAVSAG
jgi:hypothetical protein